MANPERFYIGGNDEHGLNPPTLGKRTPTMPYVGRSFYENEFNRPAKYYFLLACLRTGFNVFDVKPEIGDVTINDRSRLCLIFLCDINRTRSKLLVLRQGSSQAGRPPPSSLRP